MNKLALFALFAVVLFACRKEDQDTFEGPSLADMFGPFFIVEELTVTPYEVDFSAGENVVFNMELSKNTDWEIQMIGENSGATRTILGNDRVLSSANATWQGEADIFPSFNLEKVYITVSFPNEAGSPVFQDSVMITGLKPDVGFLITSFEEGIGSTWQQFNQTTVQGVVNCNAAEAAKGGCFYSWNGTVGWDWAIGSVTIRPQAGQGFGLPASANNLFFNIAFKAIENVGTSNSFLLFWFDEDDDGDGIFEQATEDRFIYEYWSNSFNWDLISRKYSDLKFDADGVPQETNGNGLPEPSKLVSINVFFLANPQNGNSRAQVDHLIFTLNEPYKP
jgi:hypothetical protein